MPSEKLRIHRTISWFYDVDPEADYDYIDAEGNLMTSEQIIEFEETAALDWILESINWGDTSESVKYIVDVEKL